MRSFLLQPVDNIWKVMLMISYINIMLTIRARFGRAQLNLKFYSNQNKFTQNNITAICCRKCVKVSFS